jgi:hypothetical protein
MSRPVALRVNGQPVQKAEVRRGKGGWELIVTDPLRSGEFSADASCTFELLELLYPAEARESLSNGGWRKVSLRIVIGLLRCRAIVVERHP